MAILTIISAFILVMLIVYATNAKKINELFGWGQKGEATVEESYVDEAADVTFSEDQIGSDLSGFMLDEDFFDETETIPSVVVRKKTSSGSSADATDSGSGALSGEEGADTDADESNGGSGMAVVGQLTNPNPEYPSAFQDDATGASGYLTSVPKAPEGGFGQYIPADQTVTGTPVGN